MRALLLFLITVTTLLQSLAAGNDARYRYYYIEAVRQQDMENYALAFGLFSRCRDMAPDAPEVNFALGRLYAAIGQDSLGMTYLKRAANLEPYNTEYAERLANMYLHKEMIDSAATVYEQLADQQPDRTEYLGLLLRIYERQRKYDRLLATLNKLELREGQSEDITLSKMQAYSYLGDQQGAYKEIKSLVDAHPNDMKLQVMMGNWLVSNGRKEEALSTFLKVLKEEPDNAQGQMSLMDFYRAEGQIHEADSLLYHMLVNPRTEPSTRVAMMREWVRDSEERGGDSLRIIQMFDRVLQLPQKSSEVAEMKVAYMMLKNAPADSIKAGWEKVLSITPENVGARLQLINLLWNDSIDEKVIQECQKAVEYVPDEPLLYYHLGVAQYINHHYDDAIATLKRGAGNITKDTNAGTAADIYAVLGDILHKQNRIQEAYEAYDSCLMHNPDNVMCLNNYAYFLSLEAKDLKKAEKMSYRSITAEPNNSTYLDTYAWILYQQGRYEEARIYIEQALKNAVENVSEDTIAVTDVEDTQEGDTIVTLQADILEHAGDIYYRLNEKGKALEMWQKALENKPENEATLRRKIKKQKL